MGLVDFTSLLSASSLNLLLNAMVLGLLLSLVLPPIGRFAGSWFPTLGKALEQLGHDVGGVARTISAWRSGPSGKSQDVDPTSGLMPVFVLVLIAAPALSGCGPSRDFLQQSLEASRDVLIVAEPCLEAQQELKKSKCESPACIDGVIEEYRPIADAVDRARALWCQFAPDSCKEPAK